MRKVTFLMKDKKTGQEFTLTFNLKGAKKYTHLVSHVRKTTKARILEIRVDG